VRNAEFGLRNRKFGVRNFAICIPHFEIVLVACHPSLFEITNDHSLTGREGAEGGSIGGKRHPATFCGDPAGTLGKGFFPADAARAHRPEPRATNRDYVKVKEGTQLVFVDKST